MPREVKINVHRLPDYTKVTRIDSPLRRGKRAIYYEEERKGDVLWKIKMLNRY
jgi:hypothetical protein